LKEEGRGTKVEEAFCSVVLVFIFIVLIEWCGDHGLGLWGAQFEIVEDKLRWEISSVNCCLLLEKEDPGGGVPATQFSGPVEFGTKQGKSVSRRTDRPWFIWNPL